jgi:hypothetical protein
MTTYDQELLHLKEHMKMKNMLPAEEVIVDNQRHIYWITSNGLPKQASYIATRNPVGKSGPRLICSYGFIDEKEQFTYSSSE